MINSVQYLYLIFFVLLPTSYIAGSGIVDQSQCSSLIAIFLKLHVYRKNWMTEHI